MNSARFRTKRNFDSSSVHHPFVLHHAYVGFEYMEDSEKVEEYKVTLLSEGYNHCDIEDCFNFVNRFKGQNPTNRSESVYFAEMNKGEAEYFILPKNQKIYKIISFENYQVFTYYFTFPKEIKLPEKSKILAADMALNFIKWWGVVDDKTFFNPSFWQSIGWLEKEREWKMEDLTCKK